MKGLSLAPQNIGKYDWYYEDERGIDVIHEVRNGTAFVRTDSIKIPWETLRASFMRRFPKQRSARRRLKP